MRFPVLVKGSVLAKSAAAALAAVLLAACASLDARHDQCSSNSFIRCLDVTSDQCDAMFDKAHADCSASMQDNTMFDDMPDNIKQNHTNRCLLKSVIAQSGKKADKVKRCVKW